MIPPKPETRSFGCLWLIAFVVTLTMDVTRTGLAEARREGERISVRQLQQALATNIAGVPVADRDRFDAVGEREPNGLRDAAAGGLGRVRVERLDLPPPAGA